MKTLVRRIYNRRFSLLIFQESIFRKYEDKNDVKGTKMIARAFSPHQSLEILRSEIPKNSKLPKLPNDISFEIFNRLRNKKRPS